MVLSFVGGVLYWLAVLFLVCVAAVAAAVLTVACYRMLGREMPRHPPLLVFLALSGGALVVLALD
ncbi:hypothetical protein ABZ234_07820 [Nocardiopsis sp. NPDC006198]|uniref:hypothetical protein n=1 Tax=Nocardiopsis sp. NPDC006198 TaxID=3154472 RepID=UPI0033A4602F